MSRHNYSQYSNNKRNVDVDTINTAMNPITADPVTTVVDNDAMAPEIKMVVENVETSATPVLMCETVDTVTLSETVTGVVTNCAKLNVRAKPSIESDVVCVLDAMSEIEINITEFIDEWLSVCTAAGIKGYCMRKFVDVHM